MRTNLNTNLATLGVSFFLAIISASTVNGQTWYDSEGRPLVVKGREVSRKVVEAEKSDKKDAAENSEKEKSKKENVSSIIPEVLELRPELSNVRNRRSYSIFYPYSRSYYGYGGYSRNSRYGHYSRPANYGGYQHYNHGCYRPRGGTRSNIYLNYRRNGLNIRARF